MSKKSAKAFTRGLTYHAGAGIGEAVRIITTTGTVAAIALAANAITTKVNHKKLNDELMELLKRK